MHSWHRTSAATARPPQAPTPRHSGEGRNPEPTVTIPARPDQPLHCVRCPITRRTGYRPSPVAQADENWTPRVVPILRCPPVRRAPLMIRAPFMAAGRVPAPPPPTASPPRHFRRRPESRNPRSPVQLTPRRLAKAGTRSVPPAISRRTNGLVAFFRCPVIRRAGRLVPLLRWALPVTGWSGASAPTRRYWPAGTTKLRRSSSGEGQRTHAYCLQRRCCVGPVPRCSVAAPVRRAGAVGTLFAVALPA